MPANPFEMYHIGPLNHNFSTTYRATKKIQVTDSVNISQQPKATNESVNKNVH